MEHRRQDIKSRWESNSPRLRDSPCYTPTHSRQDDPHEEHEAAVQNTLQSRASAEALRQQSLLADHDIFPSGLVRPRTQVLSRINASQNASDRQSHESTATSELHSSRSQSLYQKNKQSVHTTVSYAGDSGEQARVHAVEGRSRSRTSSDCGQQCDDSVMQNRQSSDKIESCETVHTFSNSIPVERDIPSEDTIVQQGRAQLGQANNGHAKDLVHLRENANAEKRLADEDELKANQEAQAAGRKPRQDDWVKHKPTEAGFTREKQLEGQNAANEYLAKQRALRRKGQTETEGRDDEKNEQDNGKLAHSSSPTASVSASSAHVNSENPPLPKTPTGLALQVCSPGSDSLLIVPFTRLA